MPSGKGRGGHGRPPDHAVGDVLGGAPELGAVVLLQCPRDHDDLVGDPAAHPVRRTERHAARWAPLRPLVVEPVHRHDHPRRRQEARHWRDEPRADAVVMQDVSPDCERLGRGRHAVHDRVEVLRAHRRGGHEVHAVVLALGDLAVGATAVHRDAVSPLHQPSANVLHVVLNAPERGRQPLLAHHGDVQRTPVRRHPCRCTVRSARPLTGHGRSLQRLADHARSDGLVGRLVDEDETPVVRLRP